MWSKSDEVLIVGNKFMSSLISEFQLVVDILAKVSSTVRVLYIPICPPRINRYNN